MMLESLRQEVWAANLELVRQGLIVDTFGNASGRDRAENLVVIKPSGVPYDTLRPEDLVITDPQGKVVEGRLRPSSDLPTHLALYQAFEDIGGVVHTHSRFATAWAQARREIPCLGTTHADYFPGPVPLTRELRPAEIRGDYEWQTGQVIRERFASLNPRETTAVLVVNHGPFSWGPDAQAAVHSAVLLEEIARLAHYTLALNPQAAPIGSALHEKHFRRKHGPQAYYGQTAPT